MENTHNGQLNAVTTLVGIGNGADDNIERLTLDDLRGLFLHLIGSQMRQQIGDDKLGIIAVAADDNVDDLAGLQRNHTVQFQRNGNPLIFLDTAVIMGLEIGKLIVFVQRQLL